MTENLSGDRARDSIPFSLTERTDMHICSEPSQHDHTFSAQVEVITWLTPTTNVLVPSGCAEVAELFNSFASRHLSLLGAVGTVGSPCLLP